MTDHSVRELFSELLAIQWPEDPNAAAWRRLGLPHPPKQPSEIRQHAQGLLETLQSARGNYPNELLQEAARQIKLAAREALQPTTDGTTDASNLPKNPINASPTATTTAQSVVQPIARPVAQPVAQFGAQLVAQPVAQPVETQLGVKVGVTPGRRVRSSRTRTPWLGWALTVGFALLAVAGTVFWLQRDNPWLVLEPNPNPNGAGLAPNNSAATGTPTRPSHTATQPSTKTPTPSPPAAPPTPPIDSPGEGPIEPHNNADLPTTSSDGPPTDSDRPTEPMTPPLPLGSPDVATTDPALDDEVQPKPTRELNQDSAAAEDATFLVVARQFELARVFLAAGRVLEAQAAWEAGQQRAAGRAMYQSANDLLEQLFAWRNEIYQTARERLPLLNRVGEIPVDDTFVSVISASDEGLVVRAAGQRRELSPDDIPWNLVRGILEVTSGPDEGTDRLRRVVTDCLRVHEATDEQLDEWRQAIAAINAATTDSNREYSPAKLEWMLRYLEAKKRVSKLIVDTPTLTPLAQDVWEPLLASSRRELMGDRPRLQAYRDSNRPRFEIEAELWQALESTDQTTVTRQLLTLHWVAIERTELPFYLDNLRMLQHVIELDPAHTLWRDSARSFSQQAADDAQLIEWLKLVQAQSADNWSFATTTLVGLRNFARQLATKLQDRAQRQAWTREFD